MSVNNTKTVYKCFEAQKACMTCKFIECNDVEIEEILQRGTCHKTNEKVDLENDCESWDFDENLFDDTFWIIKRKQEGER